MLKPCFVFILIWLLCCSGRAQTAKGSVLERDSALVAYYKKCKANLKSPVALDMCDTLLQMGKEKKDTYVQVISECLRLDYYYYRNDEANIIKHVDIVKATSRRLNHLKYFMLFYIIGNQSASP